MKKIVFILFVSVMMLNGGFLDKVTSFVTGSEEKKETTSQSGELLNSIQSATGLSTTQATGTVGALMGYAKGNMTSGQYSGIMEKVPALAGLAGDSSGGLTSMVGNALSSNETVNSSLKALGVEPDMVKTIIPILVQYVGKYAGEGSGNLLSSSLSGLLK